MVDDNCAQSHHAANQTTQNFGQQDDAAASNVNSQDEEDANDEDHNRQIEEALSEEAEDGDEPPKKRQRKNSEHSGSTTLPQDPAPRPPNPYPRPPAPPGMQEPINPVEAVVKSALNNNGTARIDLEWYKYARFEQFSKVYILDKVLARLVSEKRPIEQQKAAETAVLGGN